MKRFTGFLLSSYAELVQLFTSIGRAVSRSPTLQLAHLGLVLVAANLCVKADFLVIALVVVTVALPCVAFRECVVRR